MRTKGSESYGSSGFSHSKDGDIKAKFCDFPRGVLIPQRQSSFPLAVNHRASRWASTEVKFLSLSQQKPSGLCTRERWISRDYKSLGWILSEWHERRRVREKLLMRWKWYFSFVPRNPLRNFKRLTCVREKKRRLMRVIFTLIRNKRQSSGWTWSEFIKEVRWPWRSLRFIYSHDVNEPSPHGCVVVSFTGDKTARSLLLCWYWLIESSTLSPA